VGNLPFTFTETDLQQLADSRAVNKEHLRKVRIPLDRHGLPRKGFGYLEFHTPQQAAEAMPLFFHGMTIDNRDIKFDLDVGEDGSENKRSDKRSRNMLSLSADASRSKPHQPAFAGSWFTKTEETISTNSDSGLLALERMERPQNPLKAIFVGNLPFSFTENDLQQLADSRFVNKQHLRKVRIPRDSKGNNRGFGYLEFQNEEQATQAMPLFFHGMTIDNRELKFDLDVGEDGIKGGVKKGLTNPKFSLFVGNAPYGIDFDSMSTHIVELMRAKHVTNHILSQNRNRFKHTKLQMQMQPEHRKEEEYIEEPVPEFVIPIMNWTVSGGVVGPKGYCFVEFSTSETMHAAYDAIKYSEINGRPLIVSLSDKYLESNEGRSSRNAGNDKMFQEKENRSRDRREKRYAEKRETGVNVGAISEDFDIKDSNVGFIEQDVKFDRSKYSIYVGNISDQADVAEITDRVAKAIGNRNIKKIRLSSEKSGKFRGYGHIDFFTEAQALHSVKALSGLTINGRVLNVNLARHIGSGFKM